MAPSAAPEEAVIAAVDAAIAFVVGQRWVRSQIAIAVFETLRDVARDGDAQQLVAFVDAALADCGQDPILAARLTDQLLDIRNVIREASIDRRRCDECREDH